MATYSMGDLKKGLKIELDGVPYKVVEYQHVKPGKGAAFVRAKIKSSSTAKCLKRPFTPATNAISRIWKKKRQQYLYDDGEFCQFMDTAT